MVGASGAEGDLLSSCEPLISPSPHTTRLPLQQRESCAFLNVEMGGTRNGLAMFARNLQGTGSCSDEAKTVLKRVVYDPGDISIV